MKTHYWSRLERWSARWVRWHTALVLLFLVAPIVIIMPLSFNSSSYFSYPMTGVSLRWYDTVLNNSQWQRALLNSLGIGFASTLLATALGTLAALGLSRASFPWRTVVMPLLISPMITPIVVVAAGFYYVFAPLGLVDSYLGVILAHTVLGTPFVLITVCAALQSFDHSLTRAASGLGARPWTNFRRVTLPLITPAVATGAVFAFATSFDEVIVVLFIGGSEQRTVPRQMWNGIRDQIDPSILAVATLLILVVLALYACTSWLSKRNQAGSAEAE
ncbi:ABC transporter permease [Pseudomonas sp. 5P_3.1_Bac2]|uniref:ABC transporter permease n=1 Tax=Pseudomonas sp. 5P_3.1_Bac2 TaxID=2971617 RepID=UPI0021C7F67A|nr:ABC transporter permease [Pseudomonas sp. 5P_3.1_Bac2]MCU1717281.1 ABC transporter permease [Pseudomonas sp. 5P_3.1_Bac2]